MLIVFGPEIWGAQKFGGISKYFAELVGNLEKFPNLEVRVITYSLENVELSRLIKENNVTVIKKGELRSHLRKLEKEFTGAKVYHSTYYDFQNLLIAKYLGYRAVLTVYDLISEIYPENKRKIRLPKIDDKKLCIKHADKIIAISKNTATDLQRIYNLEEERVKVIYLAAGQHMVSTVTRKYESRPYFLYVGKRVGYKNFAVILQAINELKEEGIHVSLVAYGGGEIEEEFCKFIEENELSGFITHLTDSNSNLNDLYRGAIALVYPSFYEGFGIPILDAMNLECRVIASLIPSTREVGRDFVTYFDPSSSNSLARILNTFMNTPIASVNELKLAKYHSKQFSWDKTGKATADLYMLLGSELS